MGVTGFYLKKSKIKTFFCLLVTIFLLFGTASFPAAAKVNTWEISPQSPRAGDTLIISGTSSPEEEVEVSISFDKAVPVYLRKYAYEFDNIEVLNFNSFFTLRAEGVEYLNMKIKMFLPNIKNVRAEKGVATLSSSRLLPGEYKVRVKGIAEDGVSTVKLKVTSVQRLNSGKDGRFSYRYSTEPTPSQILKIKIGDKEKLITLKPRISKLSLQSPALSGSKIHPVEVLEREAIITGSLDFSGPQVCSMDSVTFGTDVLTATSHGENKKFYLARSPLNEGSLCSTTAGELTSEESANETGIQEQHNKINFFYLLSGVSVVMGFYLFIQRE